ncbi:MAG: hypothetical protein U9R40_02155 [Synergistota bacterium]|nr:hypothetical protein [Synergistota bacterium]
MPQTLLPIFPEETTPITDLLSFTKRDGAVWYFHGCLPVFSHGEKDYESFNMFTSQLVETGQCKQVDIVKAFGVSEISVKRHVKKFRQGGPGVFFKGRKAKRSTVWTPEVLNRAQELLNEGKTHSEVEELLEIKRDTLCRAIHSGRLVEHKKKRAKQE